MSIGGDLHKYLWSGSKSDFTGSYGSATQSFYGLGRKDALGRTTIHTMADLQAAASIKDKLTVADELSRVSRLQADVALRTGRADTIAKVADGVRQVIDHLYASLDAERTGGGEAGKIDPGVEPYKNAVDAVLTTYGEVAATLGAMRGKLDGDKLAAFDQAMRGLDASAKKVADVVKGTWSAVAADNGGFRPDPTKMVDIIV